MGTGEVTPFGAKKCRQSCTVYTWSWDMTSEPVNGKHKKGKEYLLFQFRYFGNILKAANHKFSSASLLKSYNLNRTAKGLNFFLSAVAHPVNFDKNRESNLSITQELDTIFQFLDQTGLLKCLCIKAGVWFKSV